MDIMDNTEETKSAPQVQTDEELRITEKAVELLKTVYDPEIPVNVYDLGLIYRIEYDPSDKVLHVDMTLTAPSCPAADFIMEDVRQKLVSIEGPEKVDLRLVFEPEWNNDMMTEEAKLELGFL
ncbi:MAG: iron-sulfur cluster assembly protein [Muribaculaceae bacterium]|nr:iron-sulfur cluster assembly protein [Muribaculaceae bacterium]